MQEIIFNLKTSSIKIQAQVETNLNKKQYPMFNCINNIDLMKTKHLAEKIKNNYKKIIVIGMGGSINSGIAFAKLYPNKLIFLDNIDPVTITQTLNSIDNCKNYFVICISKSGKSEETLLLYKLLYQKFKQCDYEIKNNFLMITQTNNNPLATLAMQNNHQIIAHNPDIGGRFSYLSIVGILIAEIANCNSQEIHQAATDCLNNYLSSPNNKNIYCHTLATQMLTNQLHANILMSYNDSLLSFHTWFQQLWAESLGKNNLGSIPISFSGTRDQHSQLQLYLANPQGKAFSVIQFNNFNSPLTELIAAYHAHANNVINNLNKTGQIVRSMQLDKLTTYNLTYLMTTAIIDVLLCAEFMQINPFGQDQVEQVKLSNFAIN